MRECGMCSLDGTIQSEIVFEPLELEPHEIENLFGDANTRKVLKALTGTFSGFKDFSGKLFVSDSGVVAVSYFVDTRNPRIVVLAKVVSKITIAYEVNPDLGFRIFLVSENGVSSHEFRLNLVYRCINSHRCGGVCWAVPIYVLLPELYPEVCDEDMCSMNVIT